MGTTLVSNTPEGIQAYRLIAALHGLRMEIAMGERGWPPTACPTRGRSLGVAKGVLRKAQRPTPRTRKAVLRAYEAYLTEQGIPTS